MFMIPLIFEKRGKVTNLAVWTGAGSTPDAAFAAAKSGGEWVMNPIDKKIVKRTIHTALKMSCLYARYGERLAYEFASHPYAFSDLICPTTIPTKAQIRIAMEKHI